MMQEGRVEDAVSQTGIRGDIEAIKFDLAALRAELADRVEMLGGKAGAGYASQRFADAARGRLDQIGTAWDQATDQGRQVIEGVQEHIEQRPLSSVGLAFVAGLLVGALLRR